MNAHGKYEGHAHIKIHGCIIIRKILASMCLEYMLHFMYAINISFITYLWCSFKHFVSINTYNVIETFKRCLLVF